MQKAYDLKALGEMIVKQCKENGLPIAEEALETLGKCVYEGTMGWVQLSAQMSENKVDDIVVPFLSHIDALVVPQIEKLDLDGDGK